MTVAFFKMCDPLGVHEYWNISKLRVGGGKVGGYVLDKVLLYVIQHAIKAAFGGALQAYQINGSRCGKYIYNGVCLFSASMSLPEDYLACKRKVLGGVDF